MEEIEELLVAIRGGYSYFFVQAIEPNRSIILIKKAVESFQDRDGKTPFNSIIWDFEQGTGEDGQGDPEYITKLLSTRDGPNVIIAKNFNWFLNSTEGLNKNLCSFLQNRVEFFSGEDDRKVLIIISNEGIESLPSCLKDLFLPITFPLPSLQEIRNTLDSILEDMEPVDEKTKEEACLSARGLSLLDVKNAFAFSLVKESGKIVPSTISKLRAKNVEKTAGLKISESKLKFDSLIGYENIKNFCKDTALSPLAKGVILLGPAGTGKSQFCRCLGNEVNRMVLEGELAELFGGFVGDSEKLVRQFIQVASANAPAILFIDELEKGLAGVQGSGSTDSGTTKRAMSQFLKFLSDSRPEGLYIVATSNNIQELPPEWIRSERWDAIFYFSLPSQETRRAILKYYKEFYQVEGEPDMTEGWSGAEIRSVCRIAKMMNKRVDEVQKYIVPISRTMEDEIKYLEEWSKGRTIQA